MRRTMLLSGMMLAPAVAAAQEAAPAPLEWPAEATSWHGPILVDRVAEGLSVPAALAFLPDGRALVGERPPSRISLLDVGAGELRVLEQVAPAFTGAGQGLHDIVVHPDFERDPWIYFSYTETAPGGTTLVLDRARLRGDRLEDRERLFAAHPAYETDDHYGGRIVLVGGYLFLTIGDRQLPDSAQSRSTHTGKIVRLFEDGRVPPDNPFVRHVEARPEVWSYGHRNPQGLVMDRRTGLLWEHEHGPRGGDELNIVRPGANYGWPRVSYGREYSGEPVGEGLAAHPGMEPPAYFYRPSIAPSGMELYDGEAFPDWRGAFLVGALGRQHLNVLTLEGDRVLHEERLLEDRRWRVRVVRQGPDGYVYLGVDAGLILRLRPRVP